MQVFELHFNPKSEKDTIVDTFYYEPENVYEKRLGHLFLAGELVNTLPQNTRFLKNLARVIKTTFFSFKTNMPEAALKKGLKKTNDFLAKIARDGDVSWISNLNFAILNLLPGSSRTTTRVIQEIYKINFTRVGDIKIFLTRAGKIVDIGKNLKEEGVEPYPLKIFFNIVSGKAEQGDRILIMTRSVAEAFLEQNIVQAIAQASYLDEKELGRILTAQKKDILGICLLVLLDVSREKEAGKKLVYKEKIRGHIILANKVSRVIKRLKAFSGQVLVIIKQGGQQIKAFVALFQKTSSKIRIPVRFKPSESPHKKPSKKRLKTELISAKLSGLRTDLRQKTAGLKKGLALIKPVLEKKNIVLILAFIVLIFVGAAFARLKEKQETVRVQTQLDVIQEKIGKAEALLILDQKEEANSLFRQAWEQIQGLVEIKGPLESDIVQIKKSLELRLVKLNKLEEIRSPDLIFEFQKEQFLPKGLVFWGEKIYCFSPYSEGMYAIDSEGVGQLLATETRYKSAVVAGDIVLFVSKDNEFISFQDNNFGQGFFLEPPFEGFGFESPASFKSHLYFLDFTTGQIVKYQHLEGSKWQGPTYWLVEETQKAIGAKSMAIDGDIWVLKQDNSILEYYAGQVQEEFKLEIFPSAQNLEKIWTKSTLPYLYILEPAQKRIVILDKKGKIVKQYQSEVFDNLYDFAVSGNGKKIYLLNGQKIYQVIFEP